MDTSDPDIYFDSQGVCNHCHNFSAVSASGWFPDAEGQVLLDAQLEKIRAEGKGKEFDCLIGLSGGVDSSYLALRAKEWGLRPLVVHVDAGWNSELAVSNISAIVKHCNYELFTHVVNWEDMRCLQLAYLRSGIANQDVPQDHIFFASTYHFAAQHKIKYILSGGNISTEGIFPASWHGSAMDSVNLKYIFKTFGCGNLINYRTISFFQFYFLYPILMQIKTIRPLNFLPYEKAKAIGELSEAVGWRSYDFKHGESLFTKIFQNYYLPKRFGFDKRRPHYSSLVASGQMSRRDALSALCEPLYEERELERDISYLCKKLQIEKLEFDHLTKIPILSYDDTPNWQFYYKRMKSLQRLFSKIIGRPISYYS